MRAGLHQLVKLVLFAIQRKIQYKTVQYLKSAIKLLQAQTLDGSWASLDLRRRRTSRQHEDA